MEKLDLQVHVDPLSARTASLSPRSGWREGGRTPLPRSFLALEDSLHCH